jgi:hypothetical protein
MHDKVAAQRHEWELSEKSKDSVQHWQSPHVLGGTKIPAKGFLLYFRKSEKKSEGK